MGVGVVRDSIIALTANQGRASHHTPSQTHFSKSTFVYLALHEKTLFKEEAVLP